MSKYLDEIIVLEAYSAPCNQRGEVVAAVVTPKFVAKVNGSAAPVAVPSSPQMMLPEPSVSSVREPVQFASVAMFKPPPEMMRPFAIVDVAVPVIDRAFTERPPLNVLVAVP